MVDHDYWNPLRSFLPDEDDRPDPSRIQIERDECLTIWFCRVQKRRDCDFLAVFCGKQPTPRYLPMVRESRMTERQWKAFLEEVDACLDQARVFAYLKNAAFWGVFFCVVLSFATVGVAADAALPVFGLGLVLLVAGGASHIACVCLCQRAKPSLQSVCARATQKKYGLRFWYQYAGKGYRYNIAIQKSTGPSVLASSSTPAANNNTTVPPVPSVLASSTAASVRAVPVAVATPLPAITDVVPLDEEQGATPTVAASPTKDSPAPVLASYSFVKYRGCTGTVRLHPTRFSFESSQDAVEQIRTNVPWENLRQHQASPPKHKQAKLRLTLVGGKKLPLFEFPNREEMMACHAKINSLWKKQQQPQQSSTK